VPANPLLAEIDNTTRQMPVILHRESHDTWLTSKAAQAKTLLQQYPHEQMRAHPVRPHVNYPEYDEPRLTHSIS
jgi:putative SOS response-associated peptidase YedK